MREINSKKNEEPKNKLIYETYAVSVADEKTAIEEVTPVLRAVLEGWGFKPKPSPCPSQIQR